MIEVFETQTELTKRFIEAFVKGERPRPESLTILLDEVDGDRAKISVWLKDKDGNELVKICRFTMNVGNTMHVMDLGNLFEFKVSAA